MELQKDSGIVLRKIPILEADIAATIYTNSHGKRTLLFKGLKKTKRRSLTAVEPGSVAHVVYYYNEQKTMYNVKEYSLVYDTISIRNNYQAMITLFLFLEIVEKTTGHNDPNQTLFRLLKGAIETLPKTSQYQILILSFILHYLKITGIYPDVFHCTVCHKEITSDLYLSEFSLHPYCDACAPNYSFQFLAIVPIIKDIMTNKFLSLESKHYPLPEINKFIFHLLLFIDSYFTIHINSKELIFNNSIK